MGNNVIGFYDSGVGGLSVLKVALNKIKNKKAYIELIDGYGLLIDSRD